MNENANGKPYILCAAEEVQMKNVKAILLSFEVSRAKG